MIKNLRLIFLFGGLAIAGVIFLQLLWLSNNYMQNKEQFLKEINLALETSLEKESSVRYDTLEQLLYRFVTDTSHIAVKSQWDGTCSTYIHSFINQDNISDRFTFADNEIDFPIKNNDDRIKVAKRYSEIYRSENLARHSAFFQTRNIGRYMQSMALIYSFDTARLRPFYKRALAQRNILADFTFADGKDPVSSLSTKSYPTHAPQVKSHISAVFDKPGYLLIRRMLWPIVTSIILLFIVGISLFYILGTIYRQKKLSVIKNDFINNITHELKTPIATASAAIEAMESFNAAEDPVKTKKYLRTSKNEMNRLSGLVDKILNISIYEQQGFDLNPEEVDIDSMINEMIQSYTLKNRDIHLSYENGSAQANSFVDRIHFYHAVNNIIDNAIKYSGTTIAIAIRFYERNNYHIVEVRDSGIGISRQDIPYIFDKFYRVPTGNTHKTKGYGLGLFYVKNIMEKHSGWCQVESEPGQGSIFKLGWPYGK